MFLLTRDPHRPVIRSQLHGFWSVNDVEAYAEALGKALSPFATRNIRCWVLSDCQQYPVQSSDVASRFNESCREWPTPGDGFLGGVGIIVGSSINLMQARRAFGPSVEIFRDQANAENWLDAQIEQNPGRFRSSNTTGRL